MKNIIAFIFSSCLLLVMMVGAAQGAGPDIGIGGEGDLASDIARKAGYETAGVTDTTLSESIGRVIKVALSLVGTVFLALTIYAGILWMTASGDEEQVTKAVNIVKRATLGLMIVLAAYGLTIFVVVAITSSSGVPSNQIGGDIGARGFWTSFGKQFKNNWYRYVFP